MKSKKIFIARGMLAAALAFALVLAGCGKKNSGGESGGGNAVQAAISAAVRETPASDFSYGLSEDGQGIVVTGYTGNGGKVVIPATIEDIPVVEIGDDAFSGKKKNITEIVIPGSVVSIGRHAFMDNSVLKSITLPDGLKTIENGIFWGCSNLTSVTLPDGLKTIEDNTFYECSNLTTVILPAGLEAIGYTAFRGCRELNNLTIPASLTGVKFVWISESSNDYPDNGAFIGCGKLPIKTRQTIQGWGYTGEF
ncbi:MAG: leucine-rich repeat domain-containing protein [Treponema sp.]|jgi:hypothetical protein|nr:leucine-rich repeat domain-containing protein [Treponema sp.]